MCSATPGFRSTIFSSLLFQLVSSQASLYQPCPILGPYLPAPTIDPSSTILQAGLREFKEYIDNYVQHGNILDAFGPITPNTTSFSIVLFGGKNVVDLSDEPFFFEYHHGASTTNPNAHSQYATGELTQLVTVYDLLAEMGIAAWERSILEFLPELMSPANGSNATSPILNVQWQEVTLGALSGHMAGIGRDCKTGNFAWTPLFRADQNTATTCAADQACDEATFLSAMRTKRRVELPDTTPIYSNAAFQLLAFAIEAHTGKSFDGSVKNNLLLKLAMNETSFLAPNSSLYGSSPFNFSLPGERAAVSMTSSVHNLALLGRSILASQILPPATTRRWLKPFSSTSNLANAVGRPWEIYHYANRSTDPITEIYTKAGTIGPYSSYFGLAPDVDVGFAILAVNNDGSAPDLNAYADMVVGALLTIESLGRAQAMANLAGAYTSNNESSLVLNVTGSDPGMAVTGLRVNGTDWLSMIAGESGIDPAYIDMRLYQTNLVSQTTPGERTQAFRAIIEDKSALVDAGTPTCISWMTVDELQRDYWALDEFLLTLNDSGMALKIEIPALGITIKRTG